MTMRLDIVTNDAGELVRREHARDLGAGVVIAIYRLAKLAQMHDLSNQAFTRQLEQTHQQITEYGLRAGMHINILFAQRAVFVAGQLLKGSYKTYEMATELGDMLEWCGGQELTIQRDISVQELYSLAEALSVATRNEKGRGLQLGTEKIRLRPVADAARLRGLEIENLSQEQRIVRNYASAVVIMRRFFAATSCRGGSSVSRRTWSTCRRDPRPRSSASRRCATRTSTPRGAPPTPPFSRWRSLGS